MTANLITGGAGFIGCNLAHRLLSDGERVILLDNLSRPNVERNVAWLRHTFGARSEFQLGDIRDEHTIRKAVEAVKSSLHLGKSAKTAEKKVEKKVSSAGGAKSKSKATAKTAAKSAPVKPAAKAAKKATKKSAGAKAKSKPAKKK